MRVAALHPDPKLVQLDYLAPEAASLTLVVTTHRATVACPDCGQTSQRIHSRYCRTVADLPWNGLQVRLRLRSRKFFCDQPACHRRIFTERLPGLVDRYARRTQRLTQLHQLLGYVLSGEAGARLGAALGVARSPDALLHQVRRGTPVAEGGPRVLGVDDFAFRKGVHYGTILVDLERRCPVDLLPDRKAETLQQWLQAHPGAEVVARDRATAYAEGIRQGAPAAAQVADRWHLLKNLTEALEALLTREHRALQAPALAHRRTPHGQPSRSGNGGVARAARCRTPSCGANGAWRATKRLWSSSARGKAFGR